MRSNVVAMADALVDSARKGNFTAMYETASGWGPTVLAALVVTLAARVAGVPVVAKEEETSDVE